MADLWFRSYHGAPFDPKWRVVARQAKCRVGEVAAVFWGLLDIASQAPERGRTWANADERGERVIEIAVAFDFDETTVEAVVLALEARHLIIGGVINAWQKRQPKREDGSAERAKGWRDRHRPQPNANEHRGEEIRGDEIRKNGEADLSSTPPASSRVREAPPSSLKDDQPKATNEPKTYTFKGAVLKVTKADFDRWQQAFTTIPDLYTELQLIDEKFQAERPKNAYATASAWIAKKHERLLRERGANGATNGHATSGAAPDDEVSKYQRWVAKWEGWLGCWLNDTVKEWQPAWRLEDCPKSVLDKHRAALHAKPPPGYSIKPPEEVQREQAGG